MDPGPRPAPLPVWLAMIGLLGTTFGLNGGVTTCQCPEIPRVPLTQTPQANCFNISHRYRYECIDGYVRKVGTSTLITCKYDSGGGSSPLWLPTPPSIVCIPNPRIPPNPNPTTKPTSAPDPNETTTQPPSSTVTKGLSDFPRHATFTTTVRETSSNLLMKINSSSSVTAGPGGTETSSSGLLDPERSQGEEKRVAPRWSTSAPAANCVDGAKPWPHTAPVAIGCTSLAIIIFSLIFISFFCYRRRSQHNVPPETPETPEELVPMNNVPPEH